MFIELYPIDIAILILSFLGGICVALVFKSKIARFFLSIIVLAILVIALTRGYSYGLENLTENLAYYIAENPLGTIGLVLGFVVGLLIKNK